ncbi:MAG: acyl-CoA dehydrogenase, partial [Caldimonas sp.]
MRQALDALDPSAPAARALDALVEQGRDDLPLPGAGATLQRWQALAAVGAHDLSLAKLFEGHTDALAILAEVDAGADRPRGSTWGVWAAESPRGRAVLTTGPDGRCTLDGIKLWCSGAGHVSHGLLTAWHAAGRGPQLVRVSMQQPGIVIDASGWNSVGMAGAASVDLSFDNVACDRVGGLGDYLARPGFWQGGAGVAACWHGGAVHLAQALHRTLAGQPAAERGAFRLAALGKIDLALQRSAAMLRAAAHWIDAHPHEDASAVALRVRLGAEDAARLVLDEAGRALGAAPFCRDAAFARAAADLPVFVRQSHAERDFAALGERVAAS